MCGILRTKDKKEFNRLFKLNLERGASSFGGLFFNRDKTTIIKTDDTRYAPYYAADDYLGHLRAPTGNQREFSAMHSHPFEFGDWIIAHNGILTNTETLKAGTLGNAKHFEVDSNYIPYLLNVRGFVAFEQFKGTWACWMYNKIQQELYITRSDNTLFYNKETGAFSSFQPDESYEAIPQHKVFRINKVTNELEEVFAYNTKPLYFVL